MPIFWRPQFRIGHDDIDADHRYLILLINTVELVLRFPDDPRNVDLALIELRRYAEYHFEREERIQIAYAYPDATFVNRWTVGPSAATWTIVARDETGADTPFATYALTRTPCAAG